MKDIAIQVKELQKSYKQLHVLKGVNFEVEKGSIFALLGSNGAGKQEACYPLCCHSPRIGITP